MRAVKLSLDGDDFITPSQDCAVLAGTPASSRVNHTQASSASALDGKRRRRSVEVRASSSASSGSASFGENGIDRAGGKKEKVKLRLADCLACSGCVTTSEVILAETQNVGELLSRMRAGGRSGEAPDGGGAIAVTVSPQSAASLAAFYFMGTGVGVPDAGTMIQLLSDALVGRGYADLVVSTGFAGDLALLATAREFVARKSGGAGRRLPLLGSSCPGWVCYAEKNGSSSTAAAEENLLVPLLSAVKSPQQLLGALMKRHAGAPATRHRAEPSGAEGVMDVDGDEDAQMRDAVECGIPGHSSREVYHCAVMPCYDKKLEASREENAFVSATREGGGAQDEPVTKEVDCVLTTGEFAELLGEMGIDLREIAARSMDATGAECRGAAEQQAPSGLLPAPIDSLCRRAARTVQVGGGSGGYADFVYRYAARELHGVHIGEHDALDWKRGRNSDMQEIELLEEGTGRVLLRFAKVYGFRNIQTLVRKIKRHHQLDGAGDSYDFVEVMACPSGCLNGGGQMKSSLALEENGHSPSTNAGLQFGDNPGGADTVKAMLDAAEASYYSPNLILKAQADDALIMALDTICAGTEAGSAAIAANEDSGRSTHSVLHTSFKALQPTATMSLAGVANSW